MLITIELKDEILKELIERNEIGYKLDYNNDANSFNISVPVFKEILFHFEELNFIRVVEKTMRYISITLTANAFSFYEHGGFYAQEQLLKAEFEKLQLELDALKDVCPERFNNITAIMANITTIMSLVAVNAR